MNERKFAVLKMKKALTSKVKLSAYTYECTMQKYEEKEECIYLNVPYPLTNISLDVIYECRVRGDKSEVTMTGRVMERYENEEGNIVKLHIEKGFYKNSIK